MKGGFFETRRTKKNQSYSLNSRKRASDSAKVLFSLKRYTWAFHQSHVSISINSMKQWSHWCSENRDWSFIHSLWPAESKIAILTRHARNLIIESFWGKLIKSSFRIRSANQMTKLFGLYINKVIRRNKTTVAETSLFNADLDRTIRQRLEISHESSKTKAWCKLGEPFE